MVIGKRDEGLGELAARHLDGAHHEVEAHHAVEVAVDVAIVLEQVGYGGVHVAAALLGGSHLRVVVDVGAAAQRAQKVDVELLGVAREMVEEDVGCDEGAGVDEGVAGDAVLVLQLPSK